MSRPVLILMVLTIAATATSGAAFYLDKVNTPTSPKMSEEQHITHEKSFGVAEELPPIEKG